MKSIDKKHKIIGSIPFISICIIISFSWFEIITTEYAATWRHYTALILVLINMIIYFIRYKQAVIFTGIIFILATFNLLSFFMVVRTSSLGINIGASKISTPEIQLLSLTLLTIYCIINFNFLTDWYMEQKEKKANKK